MLPLIYAPVLPLSMLSGHSFFLWIFSPPHPLFYCLFLYSLIDSYIDVFFNEISSSNCVQEEPCCKGSSFLWRAGCCFRPWNLYSVSFVFFFFNIVFFTFWTYLCHMLFVWSQTFLVCSVLSYSCIIKQYSSIDCLSASHKI